MTKSLKCTCISCLSGKKYMTDSSLDSSIFLHSKIIASRIPISTLKSNTLKVRTERDQEKSTQRDKTQKKFIHKIFSIFRNHYPKLALLALVLIFRNTKIFKSLKFFLVKRVKNE